MNTTIYDFFITKADKKEFWDKRVLEVGSRDVNGSLRPFIELYLHPKLYIGVDIENGKGVDRIIPAEELTKNFGIGSFDVVLSSEMLEHVIDWRKVINEMKSVLKESGYIYLTTRSLGFVRHSYPYDCWRFELDDMRQIFSDFEILKLEKDKDTPGVLLKARKPMNWKQNDLLGLAMYSMILEKRTPFVQEPKDMPVRVKMKIWLQEIRRIAGIVSRHFF